MPTVSFTGVESIFKATISKHRGVKPSKATLVCRIQGTAPPSIGTLTLTDGNSSESWQEAAIAWAQLKQGRYADAEGALRGALDSQVKTSPDVWERFNTASMLGASLAGQRRFADAEPLLIEGYEGMATRKPSGNPNFRSRFTLRESGEAILQLYTDWGNAEKRAAWAARLEK